MIQNTQPLQHPVQSGFNAESTAQEVIKGIDLTGKTVIITGGYAGIGLETTKALASAGAKLIVPARDIEKAGKNLAGIENIELEKMDLMDPASIDNFSQRFLTSGRKLDLLINNAGIMWVPYGETAGVSSHSWQPIILASFILQPDFGPH